MGAGKLVLGLGDNIDFEVVWDQRVVDGLITEYAIRDEELNTDIGITTERELLLSILAFMKSGRGGERYVASPGVIHQFASRLEYKTTLGGTSVRGALAMEKLGISCTLHLVTLNNDVRRLLPKNSRYICAVKEENSYPHLIIQFSKGMRVKAGELDFTTSRSNRLIYDNDPDNVDMPLSPMLGDELADARLFLISGFNAMQSGQLLQSRLQALLCHMKRLPKDATVLFEDACYHTQSFTGTVRDALLPFISIYSLNEDELQTYLSRGVDLLSAPEVLAALEDLHRLIRVPLLVVHTRYWALAFGENAKSLANALKGGITMATTRFCLGDDFTQQDYAAIEKAPPEAEGSAFASDMAALAGEKVCCLPSVNADVPHPTTIGLGDSFVGGFIAALCPI